MNGWSGKGSRVYVKERSVDTDLPIAKEMVVLCETGVLKL